MFSNTARVLPLHFGLSVFVLMTVGHVLKHGAGGGVEHTARGRRTISSMWTSHMEKALSEAHAAAELGEVPVGAVLLDSDGRVVASDHNRREEQNDPTAHAEMLVLSSAAREAGDWRLGGHTLIVTLEPCVMCAGAAVHARLERIVYGAADLKAGAAWSLFNIPQDRRLNHRIELVAGVMEDECGSVLSEFFQLRR